MKKKKTFREIFHDGPRQDEQSSYQPDSFLVSLSHDVDGTRGIVW